ncbi:Fanconi-associated nuclease 1 [Grifola frondosa]|uniref:Fanconi-associated nuclease n=1 Tax=Grifola frondosa TaxID=5627 RepID=A0A1C7LXF1_GRIFR|nr:Fanconi-associated nuclease 1 [Grifola frondosa]
MDIKMDGPEDVAFKPHEHHETETIRMQNARAVKAIFEEVYDKWKVLVQTKGEETARPKGLARFDCGHVLTRVVCKGAYALGILKEYEREYEVLQALLGQRRWRLGRRGRWYERRALILMTYFPKNEASLRLAWAAVWEALGVTHTYRISSETCAEIDYLGKAAEDTYGGSAFLRGTISQGGGGGNSGREGGSPPKLDPTGSIVSEVPVTPTKRRDINPSPKKVKTEDAVEKALENQFGKAEMAKSFHCEGRIVGTLFALLFWDIIFAPVAGAFETPYQSAPLDIAEDTFYLTRQELADARLREIKEGHAAEILEQVYDEHAKKRTWCVGVRWDLFGKEDLLGITRLLCEDYAGRLAGVPDLIIWDDAKGDCKFVEVKGPGDNLQENQKVWINVLLQAGTPVEQTKKSTGKRKRKEVNSDLEAESEDEPEIDYSQMDVHSQENVLPQCPKTPSKSIVNRAEVVITSSPHSSQSLSPAVKRRRL